MGYSPGFLLKNRQFSTLVNSPEIDPKSRARSQKSFYKGLGGVSESLERFPELAKIRHVQNHGLQPRLFAQKPQVFDTCEFTRNRPKKSRKELEILLQGFRRRFREFGAISRTCQNPPCSKTMGYSPGFLLKNRQFSTLVNSPEIDPKSRARSQKSFYKGLGSVSENLERFPELAKIRHVQNHGLQPRLFAQKPPIFDTCEFTRNRPKQSRKELEILLQGFKRRFREFGAISRTCQNPPCSKPWAIAQAFCSKTANFRHLRIHPKSTQKVAQGVRNPSTRVQEAFQRVWSDFQNLPKSAMFKTIGYSPGFLLKNRQFSTLANSPENDPKSRARSQKSFYKGLGGVSESLERFPQLDKIRNVQNHGLQPRLFAQKPQFSTLANSPEIDPKSRARSQKSFYKGLGSVSENLERFPQLAKIRNVQDHGLQPRLFAQKPPIFDTCEFTRNRSKKSGKKLEILLQGFLRRFREFGAISRSCQNTQCSKPWAIAQAFCSKTANFRNLRIHPKSTQKVAQGVRNPFPRVQEAFQRVWSDFQNLPKSAMFTTMGYSPGFLLKNRQFSTLANSPKIDTRGRARSWKSFSKGLGGVSESLERFPELAKIRHVQNHGLQPSLFAQRSLIFDTCEFPRNRPKKSRKELEILLQGFRKRFREFGAISTTCQNPQCSRPWAIAQAFCSKTANFRHLRIHPKSTQKVAQGVRNPFTRVQEAFQRVWSDFQNLPKSAMFETMGYSPGFLLKNRQFSTLANSP